MNDKMIMTEDTTIFDLKNHFKNFKWSDDVVLGFLMLRKHCISSKCSYELYIKNENLIAKYIKKYKSI